MNNETELTKEETDIEQCVSDMVCAQCGTELDSETGLNGECDCICHTMV